MPTSGPKIVFMNFIVIVALIFAALLPSPANAKQINVVASIRPIYALVLAVGDGVIAPQLILPGGASAHDFQLRPSDVKKIANADILFWVGPTLETTLTKPIATHRANAQVVTLLEDKSIALLPYGYGQNGTDMDPHIWLTTINAIAIVDIIAKTLIDADPDNESIYKKNAKLAKNRIKSLRRQMIKYLKDISGVPFVVQHDGFSYLFAEFKLNQRGSIAGIKGSDTGARHITNLKKLILDENIKCIFTEPQMASQMAKSLSSDSGVRLGELDGMGVDLDDSPTLYVRIMQKNARALLKCLNPRQNPGDDAGVTK